jgi:hypothetical protein
LVIAVAAALTIGIWLRSQPKSSTAVAITTSTTVATNSTEAPLTGGPSSQAAPTNPVPTSTSVLPSTTTVIGTPVSIPGSITYTVAAGTPIKVVALSRCWIEARVAAGGTILTNAILQAGQATTFSAPIWLRLGDPTNVRVTAGGTALQLPALSGDLIVLSQ